MVANLCYYETGTSDMDIYRRIISREKQWIRNEFFCPFVGLVPPSNAVIYLDQVSVQHENLRIRDKIEFLILINRWHCLPNHGSLLSRHLQLCNKISIFTQWLPIGSMSDRPSDQGTCENHSRLIYI